MFINSDIISKLKNIYHYKESSIKTMNGQIKRLHIVSSHNEFNEKFIKNFNKVSTALNNFDKINVKKAILNTTIKVLSCFDDFDLTPFEKLFNQLVSEHSDKYLYTKPSKEMISISEIISFREKYKVKDSHINHLRYVILSLYSMLPPLRGEDFYNTLILRCHDDNIDINKDNYYSLAEQTFVFNTHKTVKSSGKKVVNVSNDLHKVLFDWSIANKTKYLIPTVKNTKMSQQGFTDLLNRIFKPRKISVDNLRQSYVTNEVCKMSPKSAKHVAKIMGHSIKTQQIVYRKYVDNPQCDSCIKKDKEISRLQQLLTNNNISYKRKTTIIRKINDV
jgi:hypothetical protein